MSLVIQNIPLPSKISGTSEWINFHQQLLKKFGKINANAILLMSWSKAGNSSITDEPDFIDYFKKYDIDLSSDFDKIKSSISNISSDFMQLTGNAAKILKYLLPIAGGTFLIWGTITMFKQIKGNVKRTASDINSIKNMSAQDKISIISKI